MRLFIAAELPAEMLNALAQTSAALRDAVRGRYVGPDLFHVTLAFLGELPAAQVDDVAQALYAACADVPPFWTSLGALGTFGRSTQAVLWQGFDTGRHVWDALARSVREELHAAGFSYDGKGFLPHVTLMRRANVAAGVLPMPCVATGTVEAATLFCSDLSGDRPHYEALERVALRG